MNITMIKRHDNKPRDQMQFYTGTTILKNGRGYFSLCRITLKWGDKNSSKLSPHLQFSL